MIREQIAKNVVAALDKLGIKDADPEIQSPANPVFGDYSTNIAMRVTRQLKKSPIEIAQQIVDYLPKNSSIAKTEIIKPGFLNFWIAPAVLVGELSNFVSGGFRYSQYSVGPEKKIIVEFGHPNTHKLYHIGHLRNISIGESLVRLLETAGNKVIRANYQGDVGLHIAKCLWYIKYGKGRDELATVEKSPLSDKIAFLGKAYAAGQVAYDEDAGAKKQILKINAMIYGRDQEILPLWEETRSWSLEYFDRAYRRLGSRFDRCYFESELPERAVEICHDAEIKGLLVKSQGALVFNGKEYGLDTRVFINSLGFPTYEGKEMALAEKEFSDFGVIDKCIHVVTPEQTSFFKVTFKVEELLDAAKFTGKQQHLAYEWVKLKEGKMSSRTGNVIEADWLLDEAKRLILSSYNTDANTAEKLAVAAVKYSFLKNGLQTQIAFSFDESISLEGDSGIYLLYCYARCQSVLRKAEGFTATQQFNNVTTNEEELSLLRTFIKFPETVLLAGKNFAPNYVANYLYDLAQKYNLFYQKHSVLQSNELIRSFRLALTQATGNILKEGLRLLGIETVEHM